MQSAESPKKLLLQKVIFHHQYDSIYTLGSNLVNMYKLPFTVPGTNNNSFINSSLINNSVSTLHFLTNNGYPPCIFDNTFHKFLYIIFS